MRVRLRARDGLMITFSVTGSLAVLFILIPILLIFIYSDPSSMTMAMLRTDVQRAFIVSLSASTVTTLIALIIGIPIAYVLARAEFKGKRFLESLVDLPIVIPHSVAGIAILVAFGSKAPLGGVLSNLGLVIEDTFWGVVFAMLFVSLPLMIDSVKDGFRGVDVELENVARTLGASSFRVFTTITMPLAFRHVLTGSVLTWARSMSEVGAIMVVAYFPRTAQVLIIEEFETMGMRAALPIAATLLIISIAIFAILRLVARRP